MMRPGTALDGSPLGRALRPRGVAVVGASRDPAKRGHQVVKSLLDRGFSGRIHPVNPRWEEILGLPASPSVEAIEDPLDLAVICTPAETVPEILETCGRRGVAGAVVLAGGFRELGAEGSALEARVLEVARSSGVRVIGPNTSGVLNLTVGLDLIGVPRVQPGPLGLIAQSGNTALGLLTDAADQPGPGFSLVVGVGNETDVRFHEYLDLLGRDPNTRAILVHAESFSEGRAFLEVARRVARSKPIVALKGGRSRAGDQAARSHTGAVATDHATVRAALRQAGVIEVTRSDDLLPVGRTLESQPPATGGLGLAILADGGGHGTLAADTLEELGVPLAPLSSGTRERLHELLGPRASVANPVDLAGAADAAPAAFPRALEVLMADPAVSGVLMVSLFGGYASRFTAALEGPEREAGSELIGAASRAGKPLVVHSIYAESGSEPLGLLRGAGVPVFRSVETACRAAAASWQRGRIVGNGCGRGNGFRNGRVRLVAATLPGTGRGPNGNGGREATARPASRAVGPARHRPVGAFPFPRLPAPPVLAALREERSALLETETRELLRSYRVPVVPGHFCTSRAQVVEAFRKLGPPVVLKAVSGTILHKSDAGGVLLDVGSPEEAAAGFRRVLRNVHRYARARDADPDLRGVLVCPMLKAPEVELLAGVRRDRVFGPVLTLGAGGTAVEVLEDVALRVLPVTKEDVSEMVDQLRIAPILRGYRGRPGVDMAALAKLLMSLARCIGEQPSVAELEVNPVFAGRDGVAAVDARAYLVERGPGR